MSALEALLGRGAQGVPSDPVDFTRLLLPRSPNTCLVVPNGTDGQAHLRRPPFPVPPDTAWSAVRRIGDSFPRTFRLAEWPELRHAQWVVRSAVVGFPDIVAIQVEERPEGSGIFLYSRSLIGWSDLGVNRRRAEQWLDRLDAALRLG